jgi:hypothetical protein
VPFEASLSTILFGPERRLAIVDGRIVGEGDEIRGRTSSKSRRTPFCCATRTAGCGS